MENIYSNAVWVSDHGRQETIRVDINGVTAFVPASEGNTDYQNIMQLVAEGKLTIAPADTSE